MVAQLKDLPANLAPRDKSPANKKDFKYIPKKIFQTYKTNKVTPGMYDAVYTWIDKNPDWEYYFFDDKACRDFIKDNFTKKVLDAYDTIIPGAYKADFWRYCVLFVHGGVYSDIKQELLVSLNEAIPEDIEFLSVKDLFFPDREFDGLIFQAFICTKPKHPFLKKAIDMIVENVDLGYYGHDYLSITGPGLLGRAVNLVANRPEASPNYVGVNEASGYKYLLWSKHSSNNTCITFEKVPLFREYYSDYYFERLKASVGDISLYYSRCWYFGKVYTHGKVYRPNPASYYKKIKSERASWVNSIYKYGYKKKARCEFLVAVKKGHVSLRLLWLFIRYEFVRPVLGLFKLRNKKA